LIAPNGTPPAVARAIYNAVATSFTRSDAVARMLQATHLEAVVSTPERMAQQIASERERWSKVIRATGIRVY
jgi:tripartite-type tricarboxylate transporter receptor subunit TctC